MRAAAILLAVALAIPCGAGAADYTRDETASWASPVPTTLDPHGFRSTGEYSASLNLYDRLYRYQGNPPELVPSLATGHTVSADGLNWEFKLRGDVKFHDGTKLTANDVVYSFRRLLAINRGPAGVFTQILKGDKVTAPDPQTVRFTLEKPYAPFLAALPIVGIVNEAEVRKHEQNSDWAADWMKANEAGSGPYMLVPGSFQAQTKATLEWFPDYFLGWPDKPIKKIHHEYVKEVSTKVLAVMKGEMDGTDSRFAPDQIDQLSRAAGVVVSKDESMRIFLIHMHNQRPPLDNVHVRRAISYAFNYKGFISGLLKDLPVRNPAPMPRNLWGYPSDIKGYEYNMAKAKEELDKARAQGVDLSRTLTFGAIADTSDTVQAGELLQADLRKLGLKIEIEKSLFQNFAARATKPDSTPDMWTTWVSGYYIDPENWIGEMYDSKLHGGWKGSSWYKNPKVDELLSKARVSLDRQERIKLYQEAARQVVDDAASVWIYNSVEVRALRDRVKGYSFSAGGGEEFRYMSLVPGK